MLSLRFGSRGILISGKRLLSMTPSRLTESSSSEPPQEPKKKAAKSEPAPVTPSKPNWDNSKYQVSEYYQHNPMSFFDLDVEMASQRLPQPSSLKQ